MRVLVAVVMAATLTAACSAGSEGTAGDGAATTVPTAVAGTGGTSPATPARPTAPASTAEPPTTTTLPATPADDPVTLAAQIAAVERTIRDPSAAPVEVAAAGRLQQLLYRRLVGRPEWDATVRSLLPADLVEPFELNLRARRVVVEAAQRNPRPPPDTLPAWEIVEPLPPEVLRGFYDEAAAATGVPWEVLAAINLVETRMGRIVGLSSAGARGPMQFLPSTWAECCAGDIDDPRDAIMGAARYLVMRGAPGDLTRALYGYNPSDSYVAAVTAYAEVMRADERAYLGYHAWQVFVPTSAGTVRLPIGYRATEPVDAAAYLAAHPDDAA